MIIASLLVTVIVVILLFEYQKASTERQIKSQGVSLTRLLSEATFEKLFNEDEFKRILDVIRLSHAELGYAYSAIVDITGEMIAHNAVAGMMVPAMELPVTQSQGQAERMLKLNNQDKHVMEFYAPLKLNGDLSGFIRLAYFIPKISLNYNQLSFFAMVALPIFLLTPLFYFLIRQETKPLLNLNKTIESYLDKGNSDPVELVTSSTLADFSKSIASFIEHAQNQISELQFELKHQTTTLKLLSYQRSRVENMLQAISDGILVLDESGIIIFSNQKISNYLNVNSQEILRKDPTVWCENKDVLDFFSRCTGRASVSLSNDYLEYSPEHNSDTHVQVRAYPVFSPKDDQLMAGTLVVFRDITLEFLARRSRGEFVAHVSHELKSPLNVVATYAEALQGEDGSNEEFRVDAVNIISDEVERLNMLINNLLSLTSIEMGSMKIEKKRVRLNDLLEDAFNSVTRSGKDKELKFNLNIPSKLSAISVDKDLLRIAINNLLTNAIKYNRAGGEVTLTAEETDEIIRISVKDTGIGISTEDQQTIFDKFTRSDDEDASQRDGHGLGLALAKDIVKLHNANLRVNSEKDQGSEFVIEFNKSNVLLKQAI